VLHVAIKFVQTFLIKVMRLYMLQILFETHFLFKNIVWMPVVMSEIFQLSHVYNIRGIYVR